MKDSDSKMLVNYWKLVYVPLIIALIGVIFITSINYIIIKRLLIKQMEADGLVLANEIVLKIQENSESIATINQLLEDKLKMVGNFVIKNRDNITNDFLIDLQKETGVDEINWFSETGEILYSNFPTHKEWKAFEGHPLYLFIQSDDEELIEDIRKDAITGKWFKYGAIKANDGSFVQIGILAENIENLTTKYSYEALVDRLSNKENIFCAKIIDKDFKIVADGQRENIGHTIHDGAKAIIKNGLEGISSTKEICNKEIGEKVLDVVVPIKINDEINHVFILGMSMKEIYNLIYLSFGVSFITGIGVFLLFLWGQNKNIIKPVRQLDYYINKVDMEKDIHYRIKVKEEDTFEELSISINSILDQAQDYFEELVGAYEQLKGSEEALKIQYNEIQDYTETIEHMAYHDTLTSLPNRRSFMEFLDKELECGNEGVVMLLDIDNFKSINDTNGHIFGDKVLMKVGEILETTSDNSKVFRFGGDEFLIIFKGPYNKSLEDYVEKLRTIFKEDIIIDNSHIHLSFSMGITKYPQDGKNIDQLMVNADTAMYAAKFNGKNRYLDFDKNMLEKFKGKIGIENILRDALKKEKFTLLYQPQVSVETGEIISFEALLRLKDQKISPAKFIPVAEETGMILDIGRWVTKKVIEQMEVWKNKGFKLKPVSINFSTIQVRDKEYHEFLKETLEKHEINPKYIEIEITESILIEKTEGNVEYLNKFKELGVSIALDDFGTGYSSLNYLTYIPIDKVKLDKTLNDKFLLMENIKIMDSIISLVHSLGLKITAEGIEERDQYKKLKVAGCDYIQGYLFSKPLSSEEVEKIYKHKF